MPAGNFRRLQKQFAFVVEFVEESAVMIASGRRWRSDWQSFDSWVRTLARPHGFPPEDLEALVRARYGDEQVESWKSVGGKEIGDS